MCRVVSVRRNVRMYSRDLVRSCAGWAAGGAPGSLSLGSGNRDGNMGLGIGSGGGGSSPNDLRNSKEWLRISPVTNKSGSGSQQQQQQLPPRYADGYRKRLDLPPNFVPDAGASAISSSSSTTSTSTTSSPSRTNPASATSTLSSIMSTSTATSTLIDEMDFSLTLSLKDPENRFRSLTDKKWGEFEEVGFGGVDGEGVEKRLQFDLNESARSVSGLVLFFFCVCFGGY